VGHVRGMAKTPAVLTGDERGGGEGRKEGDAEGGTVYPKREHVWSGQTEQSKFFRAAF